MASGSTAVSRIPSIHAKHVLLGLFGVMLAVTFLTRDRFLFDANSPLRQRYAAIPVLMFLHGVPGAIALFLGVFQFSSRLRARHLQLHRVMGRTYVGSVLISAPAAVVVSLRLPTHGLTMASVIQASGWILTTLTALYCVRIGKIQQHREWMMRSYPFAMVFIVARVVTAIPQVNGLGEVGIVSAVWSAIATACFLPSFVIAWQNMPVRNIKTG